MATTSTMYQATLAGRLEVYKAYLAAGEGTPFIYPWDTLPALYLFLGIIVRPYLSPILARLSGYVSLVAVVSHSAYVMRYRRSLGFAGGYGVGLACIWGIIMTVVLLVLHDPQKDFVRLELREAAAATIYTQTPEGVSYSLENDDTPTQSAKHRAKGVTQSFVPSKSKSNKSANDYRLVWQTFPTTAIHCIDWTVDLITSFRGPNWNFRIPTLAKLKTLPPPKGFKTTKAIEASILANETNNPSNPTSSSLIRASIIRFSALYLFIDFVKFVMITDPYFLGLRPLTSPSPWPFFAQQPLLTKFIRLIISVTGVLTALNLIFSLAPLLFYTLLPPLVPQSTLIKYTRAPLYDPRMYDPLFQPLYTSLSKGGLPGFWGRYWHQMFRFGISEPSLPIIKALNLNPRSQLARAIQLFVAFGLTGTIHAVASYTTFSIINSKPRDAFIFFILQAVGIMIQDTVGTMLTKKLKLKAPLAVRRAGNLAFVFAWLWFSGPWLADDFARAGIWLFEPIPISLFRGFTGQGWWHWKGKWAGFYKGDSIFSSGLAVY